MPEPITNAEWFEQATGVKLDEGQARCLETLCAIERVYNVARLLRGATLTDKFAFRNGGLAVQYQGSLATFDGSELTRLVVAAHRNCVRVEIGPPEFPDDYDFESGDPVPSLVDRDTWSSWLTIFMKPRKPGSTRLYERHPTWEQVANA